MSRPNGNPRGSLLYRALFTLHLYTGLLFGLFVVIVGLSGSVIVYWRELDAWLNPDMTVAVQSRPLVDMDTVVAALRATHPQHYDSWRIKLPERADRPIVAEYYDPPDRRGTWGAAYYVLLDPYSGAPRSGWYWNETLVSWIYTLHMYLQAGAAGHDLVGAVGIVLLLLTLNGLYLWWPRGRWSRAALLMKLRSDWPRFEYDSHRLAGLYSLIVMVVVTVTGLNIIWPNAVGATVSVFSPLEAVPQGMRSAPAAGRAPIAASTAFAVAQAEFPDARVQTFVTPSTADSAFRVILRQPFELSRNDAQTQVWIDQYSGAVLAVRDPRTFNTGTTLHSLTYALHNGEAFGEPGKFIVFLLGPVLLWLYVTGVTRWWRLRRLRIGVAQPR